MSIGAAPNVAGGLLSAPVCVTCGGDVSTVQMASPNAANSTFLAGLASPADNGKACCFNHSVSPMCDPCNLDDPCCRTPPQPCCTTGTCPDGPGPYYQGVATVDAIPPGLTDYVEGLQITCQETGVTQTSGCNEVIFYHNSAGLKHYSTPGGIAPKCPSGPPVFDWGSGSAAEPIGYSGQIYIQVSHN